MEVGFNMNNLVSALPNQNDQKKRNDYISWEDYFMANAILSSKRSKDPHTQVFKTSLKVGACIVNEEKKIVAIGYNGMPKGCSDDELPWAKHNSNPLANKYLYVCHAEMNAILNKNSSDVKNCIIFVTLFPCNECAKLIIQSGIKEVVYLADKHEDEPIYQAARQLFRMADIKFRKFTSSLEQLTINFKGNDSEAKIKQQLEKNS